jgi:putative mycofactocin binding protein MftB
MSSIHPDTRLRVSDRVSIRPEPFGALLYHFGTRRLSFLKSTSLLAVVEELGAGARVGDAIASAGVADTDRGAILVSLGTLRDSDMLEEVAA